MRKRLELERVTKNANVTCTIKKVSILKGCGFDRAFFKHLFNLIGTMIFYYNC